MAQASLPDYYKYRAPVSHYTHSHNCREPVVRTAVGSFVRKFLGKSVAPVSGWDYLISFGFYSWFGALALLGY